MQKAVVLKERGLRPGHPWFYAGQIARTIGAPAAGDVVRVLSGKVPLGIGYYNPQSQISVRLLDRHERPIDAGFFRERIERAAKFRARWVSGTSAYRLVSSEADGLPGLVVDRYGEMLVVQFLTLGMEKRRDAVLDALDAACPSRGIYERSDSSSRRLEGLEDRRGWLRRECGDEIVVTEGGVKFAVRLDGQKTGLYLDQRENRIALASLGLKGSALDAFCYEGGFALHLARSGMTVLGLDSQADAVAAAEKNRALNDIPAEKAKFQAANAFDALRALEKEGRRFDLVVLDPPSFVKKKAALEGAMAGYKEILLRGMRLLSEDGLLAVFSCSYHVDENLLMQAALAAAHDTRHSVRLLRFLRQSADHPIDPFIPETYYLKGFLFQIAVL